MYDRSGVRLSIISALPTVAEAHGVPLHFLMSVGGLRDDALRDWDSVVSRSQTCAILDGLARKSGDATIGFQMAEATNPAMLGLSGAALLAGRTLGEAISLQISYLPWLQQGVSARLETDGKRARWRHRLVNSDPLQSRILTEGIAAFFVGIVRAMSGRADARMHVALPHRAVVSLNHYQDALRCAVSFTSGPDLVIHFDAELLDYGNALLRQDGQSPDPAAAPQVPTDFEMTDQELLEALYRMFGAAALMGRLSLPASSVMLGLSPRSLQRRLAGIGTTFEEAVDSWRRDAAKTMLALPGAKKNEIAACLGYADASHFVRAFRRWEGVPPGQFLAGTMSTSAV